MSILIIPFSLLVGVLIGSVGIGGVLLVPILTYVFDFDIHGAIAVAMFGYLFTGFVGLIIYGKHGSIDWSMAFWLICGAMPGAFLGSILVSITPGQWLEFLIAAFLFFSSGKAFFSDQKEYKHGSKLSQLSLLSIGIITGIGSALSGTGGPLVLVPVMVFLKVTTHTAIGLSQAVQLPVAGLASIGNVIYGQIDWFVAGILGVSLAFGGAVGGYLAHLVPEKYMSKLMAWVLFLVGCFVLSRSLLP